jgi:hypothetical protein
MFRVWFTLPERLKTVEEALAKATEALEENNAHQMFNQKEDH